MTSEDKLTSKSLCDGFDLVTFKSLSQMLLEFYAHNTSKFLYKFRLVFTELANLGTRTNQAEFAVEVSPNSSTKVCGFPILGSFSYKYKFVFQKVSPEPQVKTEVVDDNLCLRVTQHDQLRTMAFELVNDRPEFVKFELKFAEMVNAREPVEDGTVYAVYALPRSVTSVCELVFEGEWTLSYSFTHTIMPESVDLSSLQVLTLKKLADSRQSFHRIPIDLVALPYLSQILSSSTFTDPFFPPSYLSISAGFTEDFEVHWRRPAEFLSGDLVLCASNTKRAKIVEGKFSSNWLKCALCSISVHSDIIQNIIENSEVSPEGIYRVTLFKNGERTWVSIDDLIPCYPGSMPMFTRSHDLWVMLLEKAFAKLLGSYECLNAYSGMSGLIDLTGCPAYSYPTRSISHLWHSIGDWLESGFVVIAQNASDFYVTIKSAEIVCGQYLLKLKNPWLDPQQLLKISEHWNQNLQQALEQTYDGSDSSFWVDVDGFQQAFPTVILSKMKDFNEDRLRTVVHRTPEGGIADYCLKIEVTTPADLIFGIHQEDPASIGSAECRRPIDLGVAILQQEGDSCSLYTCSQSTSPHREVFIEATLTPGVYFVVPLSSAVQLQQANAEPVHMPLLSPHTGWSPIFKSTLQDLFYRLCKSNCYELFFEDFSYINTRLDLGLTPERYMSEILNKYASNYGLAFQGLLEFFADAIEFRGEATVREWMCKLGYDEHMCSIESKPIVLSCQSESTFLSSEHELPGELVRLASEELIEQNGHVQVEEAGLCVKMLRNEHCCSLLAVNTTSEVLRLSFDFTSSQNVLFSNRKTCNFDLGAGTRKVFQHLGVKDTSLPFTAEFSYTCEKLSLLNEV